MRFKRTHTLEIEIVAPSFISISPAESLSNEDISLIS